MGACLSQLDAPAHLIDQVNGNEEDYHKRYLEDKILGQGEFGVVKMVHDVTKGPEEENSTPLACKILRKGIIIKDNIIYTPLKPEVLRGEIEMLRTLGGKHYCLKLCGIYESSRILYVITEFCGGGEMMEYVSKLESDLRSEDVSRIAYQLLSAVNHCCTHKIIHRDIKPENVMFANPLPNAEIRLIDFGSGVFDKDKIPKPDEPFVKHETFAGSAFYISPELYQRDYNCKTDVWSVGVALYVLVAGYPADSLQEAFNVLQTKKRNLRTDLPNMPDNMPESFYDLLETLLVYRHKNRVLAGDVLLHEFVTFHQNLGLEATKSLASQNSNDDMQSSSAKNLRASVALQGSVERHGLIMGFKKFERSLTTLLATLLSKSELYLLLDSLRLQCENNNETIRHEGIEAPVVPLEGVAPNDDTAETNALHSKETNQNLAVCKVSELKELIRNKLENEEVLQQIATKLPNTQLYENFAYHIALLVVFAPNDGAASNGSSGSTNKSRRRGSFRRTNSYSGKSGGGGIMMTGSINSTTSNNSRLSLRVPRRTTQAPFSKSSRSTSHTNLAAISSRKE